MWEQETFIKKAGSEILSQMYTFPDKANRPICLIPEVTALIQELWKDDWSKRKPKPFKLFYVARCYRYERPQAGRYREFTQFGVEILGGKSPEDAAEAKDVLIAGLDAIGVAGYVFNQSVKRGLSYYVEDGFEVELPWLGAQKQVAGGGRYDCGIGFAYGIDRLILGKDRKVVDLASD